MGGFKKKLIYHYIYLLIPQLFVQFIKGEFHHLTVFSHIMYIFKIMPEFIMKVHFMNPPGYSIRVIAGSFLPPLNRQVVGAHIHLGYLARGLAPLHVQVIRVDVAQPLEHQRTESMAAKLIQDCLLLTLVPKESG